MGRIDVLSYYDKLERSVDQAYGQRSAQVPKQMLITPLWANMGVYGPEDTGSTNSFAKRVQHPEQQPRIRFTRNH
jgi:hypothetical protein